MAAPREKKTTLPQLTIKLLGRFEVLRDGKPLSEEAWGRRKTKTLLKVLLTEPGRVFTQDQLIEALFGGENVDRALENLYGRVSQLRRALEPDLKHGADSAFILREGHGYSFDVAACSDLDTIAFKQGLDDSQSLAEEKDWAAAAERFEEAITLYQGEFLAEDRYEDWAEEARRDQQRLYLESMAELAECYEHLGRLRQSISCCQRILALEPHREDVIRRLMSYQAEAGQRAQALETYQEARQALREYLDVEPSTETQTLFAQLSETQDAERKPLDPRRIAVLPLVSYSPHPEDAYFADGITEELIASLSKIKDFRVVARTSVARYHGTTKPITQISRELDVGTILEGSVRKEGGKVRITAQLIDGLTEDHLWAEQYEFDVGDVLEVQVEIARRTSEALKLELLSDEVSALCAAKQRDSEAHMAYLKGRHFLQKYGKKALETAIGHFKAALRKDPAYARALTGLADAWLRMEAFTSSEESYHRAKAYAEQALALDDSLPEVYTSLAYVVEGYESDLAEMERLLRRAIQLDPSYALAHARLAEIVREAKRMDEAIEAFRTALTLDPLSPRLIAQYANCLLAAQRYVEAVDQARRALELDEENDPAWWIIWFSHAAQWDWKRGEVILREMVERYPENPLAYVFLSVSVQTNGRVAEGVALLEKALSLPGAREQLWVLHQGGVNFTMARQYDRALDLLDEGVQRWPMTAGFRIARACCYFMQGQFDKCLEEVAVAETSLGWKAYVPRLRCRVYAARGEIEKAEKELKKLIEHTEYPNRRICIAYALAGLGRIEEAIDWFEEAADAHEYHIATIRNLPTAPRELREHPRFQAFLSRVGLADAPGGGEAVSTEKQT
jgi:TolB-like protein/Tfp pilus assembly protein PilF/DNA-binding winged helix-turn-helix (wHTH) protein